MCINLLHACEIKMVMIYLRTGKRNITKLRKNSFLACNTLVFAGIGMLTTQTELYTNENRCTYLVEYGTVKSV